MRKQLSSFAVIVALAAAPAGAYHGSSARTGVAGTWTVVVKGQGAHGDMTAEMTLAQDGAKVNGTLRAHGGEHALSGRFADGKLSLATAHADASQQLTLTATLQDDGTLDGYLSGPAGDLRWTATRAKGGQ